MQEDKETAFDAIDTVKDCLALFTGMLQTMKFKKERMAASAMNGFTNATDAADYLVNKGVPFRDAHGIIGRLVLYCIEKDTSIDALSLEELKAISDKFEADIYDAVSLETCVNKRLTVGAPGPEAMKKVIALHREYLSKEEDLMPTPDGCEIICEVTEDTPADWYKKNKYNIFEEDYYGREVEGRNFRRHGNGGPAFYRSFGEPPLV